MSRKDYQAIAASLAWTKPNPNVADTDQWKIHAMEQWKADVMAIARTLAGDNYRFQMGTFLAACDWSEREKGGGEGERHAMGCCCADCSGAELSARND